MRTGRKRSGIIVGLALAVLLVPALAAGATPAAQSQSLFDQIAARADAVEAARLNAVESAADTQPGVIEPIVEGPAGDEPMSPQAADGPQIALEPTGGAPGSSVNLRATGLAPGGRFYAYLEGVRLSGELVADNSGALSVEITIPAYAPAGPLTLGLVGAEAMGGEAVAAGQGPARAAFIVDGTDGAAVVTELGLLGAPPLPAFPGVRLEPETATAQAVAVTAQPAKPWTLAVYMTADDDLANDTTNDLNEMIRAVSSAGIGPNVHVVVLVDQRNAASKYFWISASSGTALDVTPEPLRNQNLDTGNPQVFVDFMGFVAQNFPASRYAVSLWSHGAGWEGIQFDANSRNEWTMAELRDALVRSLQLLGRQRFDLLLFDACYMGGFEVLTEIQETADVVVAAPGLMPKQGLPYDSVVELLAQTSLTPAQIAAGIVTRTGQFYGTSSTYAVSAFAMGAPFDRVTRVIDNAATELLRLAAQQGGEIIQTARVNSTNHNNRFVDIGDFAAKVGEQTGLSTPVVQREATAVINALDPAAGFVLATVYNPASDPGAGLTAYFPEDGRGRTVVRRSSLSLLAVSDGYKDLRIQSSSWYRLLDALTTGRYPNLPPPVQDPIERPPPEASAAPDHDIIFAQVLNSKRVDLFRIPSSDDDAPLPLVNDGAVNFYPRWTPDGRQVAYISDRNVPPVGGISIGRNLFLINSDGSFIGDGPLQLTNVGVNCTNGAFQGTPCIVEQVGHPAWLSDGSGLLYTLYTYDFASFPPTTRSTIRLVSPDASEDFELLPAFAANSPLANYYRFDTADLRAQNGEPVYLMVSYTIPPEFAGEFANQNIPANNIAVFDFTNRDGTYSSGLSDLYSLVLHTNDQRRAGNWIYAGLPAWRPFTNEVAFLYNRIGTPPILYSPTRRDYREPLLAFQPDRRNILYPVLGPEVFATFDIGRLTLLPGAFPGDGFRFRMEYPYWQFRDSWRGVGANYRPSWKPDGSNNLTLSVSLSFGFAWDVARIASDSDADTSPEDDTFEYLTDNGTSVTPSWGRVRPEDVRQRLDVTPTYLAPGSSSVFILSGSGFAPGAVVTLRLNDQNLEQVRADARGRFTRTYVLRSAPPGPLRFTAIGLGASGSADGELRATQSSNAIDMIVLKRGGVFIPLLRR